MLPVLSLDKAGPDGCLLCATDITAARLMTSILTAECPAAEVWQGKTGW